ncbi:hypothetical protein ACFL6A_01190 [bacterium]
MKIETSVLDEVMWWVRSAAEYAVVQEWNAYALEYHPGYALPFRKS